MKMMIRTIGLFLKSLLFMFQNRKNVEYRGWPVVYCSKGSSIAIDNTGERVRLYSHPYSNLLGVNQKVIIIAKGGEISIAPGVCMSGCTIYSTDSIQIGRKTDIGSGCKIIDNDFHPLPYSERNPEQLDKVKKRPIKIGEGCFIGANSLILKGTTLGRNVVVGAGSVVCGTFPDNVIIAGNPAKIIKENKE